MKQRELRLAALSCFAVVLASSALAGLESGVYQTGGGASVEESGDIVPDGRRIVPLIATLTFDLSDSDPTLTAVIHNAVLEGGEPFPLTVRSSYGARLADGTYYFTGDYLQSIHPSGTQYGFEWRFSSSMDGAVVWNGTTGWWGGHIWRVTMSDVPLVLPIFRFVNPPREATVVLLSPRAGGRGNRWPG